MSLKLLRDAYTVTLRSPFLRGLSLNWVFNVNGAFLHNGIMGIFRGFLIWWTVESITCAVTIFDDSLLTQSSHMRSRGVSIRRATWRTLFPHVGWCCVVPARVGDIFCWHNRFFSLRGHDITTDKQGENKQTNFGSLLQQSNRRYGANTKLFLNLLIQFYLYNVTNLHQIDLHSMTFMPYNNIEIIYYGDVTSLYV